MRAIHAFQSSTPTFPQTPIGSCKASNAWEKCSEPKGLVPPVASSRRRAKNWSRGLKTLGLIGLAIPGGTVGFKAYRMWPMAQQPSWDFLPAAQATLATYSETLGVAQPHLYVHHSGPGTIIAECEPHYWTSSLIAVHADVERVFTPEQLDCLVAHEIAHSCEGAASTCVTPPMFSPWRLGEPFHDREHKADYLGSLLCGKQATIDALQALGTSIGMNAELSTHPSVASRIAFIQASNASFYPGHDKIYGLVDNPFWQAVKQVGKNYLYFSPLIGVYCFFF